MNTELPTWTEHVRPDHYSYAGRIAAAEWLAQAPWTPEVEVALRKLLDDPDLRVAGAAAYSLAKQARSSPGVAEAIDERGGERLHALARHQLTARQGLAALSQLRPATEELDLTALFALRAFPELAPRILRMVPFRHPLLPEVESSLDGFLESTDEELVLGAIGLTDRHPRSPELLDALRRVAEPLDPRARDKPDAERAAVFKRRKNDPLWMRAVDSWLHGSDELLRKLAAWISTYGWGAPPAP